MNKLDTLYELLEKSCHDIIQSEESWLSFLKTSGYLYNFNFLRAAQQSGAPHPGPHPPFGGGHPAIPTGIRVRCQ